MPGALNWNVETVLSRGDGATYGKQQLIVRGGTAELKTDGIKKTGVIGVYQVEGFPTSKREIRFEDGTIWLASRKRGCGCR